MRTAHRALPTSHQCSHGFGVPTHAIIELTTIHSLRTLSFSPNVFYQRHPAIIPFPACLLASNPTLVVASLTLR
jgi:hypothetical protein